ncbi:MAG: tyrosine-type recombinase/integrase [Verrucomicrobiota bacterium]
MSQLLANSPKNLIPYLTLGAFAGLCHAEIITLHWEDIDFHNGLIRVKAAKAKTAQNRLVPMVENLLTRLSLNAS